MLEAEAGQSTRVGKGGEASAQRLKDLLLHSHTDDRRHQGNVHVGKMGVQIRNIAIKNNIGRRLSEQLGRNPLSQDMELKGAGTALTNKGDNFIKNEV